MINTIFNLFLISYSIGLGWDIETDPSVIGYKVYQGNVSGNYTTFYDTGNLNNTYTVNTLENGETYYFAVTAYNTQGESTYSNEINFTKPIILSIQSNIITASVSVGKTYVLRNSTDLKTWNDYSSVIAATNSISFTINQAGSMGFFKLEKVIVTPQVLVQRSVIRSAKMASIVLLPAKVKLTTWQKVKAYVKYKPGMHFREPVHGAILLMQKTITTKPISNLLPPMPPGVSK